MRLKTRVLIPGLIVPGGGYMALGAWRQGLAFLSIGLLVAMLWTNLFTEFRFGLLLFWGVLSLASILGAEQVSRTDMPGTHGIAWVINGSLIFVVTGLALGLLISATDLLGVSDSDIDLSRARRLVVVFEILTYGCGGVIIGWFAPHPVRTALMSAMGAVCWSVVRGTYDEGFEAAYALLRTDWAPLLLLHGLCVISAGISAFITRVVARFVLPQPDAPREDDPPVDPTPPPARGTPVPSQTGTVPGASDQRGSDLVT